MKITNFSVRALCLALSLSLTGVFPAIEAYAAAPAPFESLVRTYRVRLDRTVPSGKAELIRQFSQELVDKNVSVQDIDLYVKTKLTAKEYAEFKRFLEVSLRGVDPEKISADQFAEIVSRALGQTQATGLTWSSCATLSVGVIVAVASVIMGIIAIVKKKVDQITQEGLYKKYQDKVAGIDSQYTDTNNKLNDPNGYFNRKINNANSSISSKNSSISSKKSDINSKENRLSNVNYTLNYGSPTEDERARLESEASTLRRDIESLQDDISRLQSDISQLQRDIQNYQSEITRYQNGGQALIDQERAANEAWYPQALVKAENEYKVNLADMPRKNEEIAAENERIERTKRTLGIIAGVGGAASLALILSSANRCEF